jgi:hypothetical protein
MYAASASRAPAAGQAETDTRETTTCCAFGAAVRPCRQRANRVQPQYGVASGSPSGILRAANAQSPSTLRLANVGVSLKTFRFERNVRHSTIRTAQAIRPRGFRLASCTDVAVCAVGSALGDDVAFRNDGGRCAQLFQR